MIVPVLKFSYRTTLKIFEILVAIAILVLGFMCFGFWKLSQGPVDVTFAAESVKKAIVSPDHSTDLQFDSIVAEWPEFSGPILIGLSGVKLLDHEKPVMNIPQLGIRIAKTPLFIGRIKPEAIVAKNATLKLYRSKNGGVHLLLSDAQDPAAVQSSAATPTPISSPPPPATETEASLKDFGEALFKGGTLPDYHQVQPLSQMERFSIENAHVVIVDQETGKGWNIPQLNIESTRAENQFSLNATYREGTAESTHFSFHLERDDADQPVRFTSDIDKVNASILANLFLPVQPKRGPQFILQGKVVGQLDQDWNLQRLDGDLASNEGEVNLDGLLDVPLKFSNLAAHISFDKASNKIVLHDTHIDVNKRTLDLSGEKSANSDDTIFKLMVSIPDVTFDDIQTLWPEGQRQSVAADWLTQRLSKGKISNLQAMIPVDLASPDYIDPTRLEMSLDYVGLTADYRAPMMPATNAKGRATLKDDILTVLIDSGKLGDMDIQKGRVEITHLTHPTTIGDVTIDADVTGNISTALEYIDREPLKLGAQVGLNPATVKGTASLNAKVTFPALADLPKDDVNVVVTAKLNNILLPSIVRGMDLTGGPYDLSVGKGDVTIKGQGLLGGQPIDLTYTEAIERSKAAVLSTIEASVVASPQLREKFGVHLDQFVEGNVPVKISYSQAQSGDETVGIIADLTPSIVKFSPFDYRKVAGKSGQASCEVLVQKGDVQKISDLKISIDKEGSANGDIQFGKVGAVQDVKSGHFSNFTLAGANEFTLDFTQTSPDLFDVQIKGKQLDGRPFLSRKKNDKVMVADGVSPVAVKGASPDQTRVHAVVNVRQIKTGDKADQMLMAPDLSLRTNAKGDLEFLDLKGAFKGGSLSVSIKPDTTGKSLLRVSSDNAGGALNVLGLYENMIGGTLDIRGRQIAGGGINDIVGRGKIEKFTVVRAPFLAKLINLFSLSGLTELLQNKGIGFENLKTDFEWKDTKSGRIISLQNGRTTGASIGLTFGGNVYQEKGTMDLSGTFVPMSEINGFFGKIPLIGGLLTGGKNGGVIAATYSMKGKSEDPTVLLNPLSVLTPGFLRSILFENNAADPFEGMVDDSEPKGSAASGTKPSKAGSFNN